MIRSEMTKHCPLGDVSSCDNWSGASSLDRLHGREANAARGTMDHNPVAFANLSEAVQSCVDRHKHGGHGRRLLVGQALRHRNDSLTGSHHVASQAATSETKD